MTGQTGVEAVFSVQILAVVLLFFRLSDNLWHQREAVHTLWNRDTCKIEECWKDIAQFCDRIAANRFGRAYIFADVEQKWDMCASFVGKYFSVQVMIKE